MITEYLINPRSIVVVGGSNDIHKTGGKALKNLIDHNFKGELYVVNLKEDVVQGIQSFKNIGDLPLVDMAIIAIPSQYCLDAVRALTQQKNTRGFIMLSAGFGEESPEGAQLEKDIVEVVESVGGSMLGPNCIGLMNQFHTSVFTTPIPKLDPKGCDFISASGATAIFVMEESIPKGLTFSSVYSVGNSAQLGVEEILAYLDDSFDAGKSSRVKLLYMESIKKPDLLLKHARSLIKKGCHIAAIKAGSSTAGSRAALSHTGALASSDVSVNALFKKAGIIRCYSGEELTTVASVFMHKEVKGKNFAIITHAGGPAVMLTDTLSNGGLNVPRFEGPDSEELLKHLHQGSSVANPVDFLATGTAEQLGLIIDYCENKFSNVDAMVVIFGSPGLFPVYDVYELLHEKMGTCTKPIFPVLPSIINVKDEIDTFLSKGHINFPDVVQLGNALSKVYSVSRNHATSLATNVNYVKIRNIIDKVGNGYLSPGIVQDLLDAAGIPRAGEAVVTTKDKAVKAAKMLGFPIVMKVVGPVHKSDVDGVVLNVDSEDTVAKEFDRMMQIKNTTAILLQPMLSGTELFVGVKREDKFGHIVLCGLGGIFIEVLKDMTAGLAPLSKEEAFQMIRELKSYEIIKGVRNKEGVNEDKFAEIITTVSILVAIAPEIFEMDLNPLLGRIDKVVAVDARIRIEKS